MSLSFIIQRFRKAFDSFRGLAQLMLSQPMVRGTPCKFGRACTGAARAKRQAARRNNIRKHPRGAH